MSLWPLADTSASSFLAPVSGLPKCQSSYSGSSAFGQVSPNHADWGSVGALRRRLVGDCANGHPGPTLGLVRAEVYGAGCHSVCVCVCVCVCVYVLVFFTSGFMPVQSLKNKPTLL